MRELFISFITLLVISLAIYFNNSTNDKNSQSISLSQKETIIDKESLTNFNGGISIRDIGEMVIIEQKPNDATIIINKYDLEDIIVFLNNSNYSE